MGEDRFQLGRDKRQLLSSRSDLVGGHRAAHLRQVEREQIIAQSVAQVNALVDATPISGPAWV